MKIALVILHADPAKGGAERYTVDLAEALARAGHEVSLLATSFAGLSSQVQCVRLEARSFSRLGQYERFIEALEKHLAGHRYDIVHAMLPVPHCDLYHPHAGIAAEAVASGHEKHAGAVARTLAQLGTRLNRKRRRFAAAEREMLCGSAAPVVLCLSQYIKEAVRRHYSVPEERLMTLINGVDLTRFDPAARPQAGEQIRHHLGLSAEHVAALIIAQDFQRKGVGEAIRAVAQVEDRRLVLVVVGKPDPEPYRRLAQSLGVGDRVLFAGATADPYAFYRSADFFVLPTRHDPCSLVVLEALAMGLPVISTKQNGACEVMSDGQEGYVLANAGEVGCLTVAMRTMLDPEIRGRMQQACLALRSRLSHAAHVQRLLAVYAVRQAGQRQPGTQVNVADDPSRGTGCQPVV